MNSTASSHMYHSSEDLLPYRCPSCGSGKRFRSLVALRMHMSIIHDMSDTSNIGNDSTCMLEKSEMEKPERMKSENLDESVSQREVDAIFNKYSGRMDNMLTKYD
uniref:C2H2-type domain-containing protein n=1 Tax=Ciona savignyi TaxID=51511 RepID=H2YL32_CIOSA